MATATGWKAWLKERALFLAAPFITMYYCAMMPLDAWRMFKQMRQKADGPLH